MPVFWGNDKRMISLVSLFIRVTDLGFLKSLCSKARFFVFGPARKIRDTNMILTIGAGLRSRLLGIREESKFYNGGDSGSDDSDN